MTLNTKLFLIGIVVIGLGLWVFLAPSDFFRPKDGAIEVLKKQNLELKKERDYYSTLSKEKEGDIRDLKSTLEITRDSVLKASNQQIDKILVEYRSKKPALPDSGRREIAYSELRHLLSEVAQIPIKDSIIASQDTLIEYKTAMITALDSMLANSEQMFEIQDFQLDECEKKLKRHERWKKVRHILRWPAAALGAIVLYRELKK